MRISDEGGPDRPEANTAPEDQLDFRVDIAASPWAMLVGEHGRDGCGEGAGPEAPVVPRLTDSRVLSAVNARYMCRKIPQRGCDLVVR